MKDLKQYRFKVLIFFVEAVYMILELVASRVLSPYFGNSNLVWTSVIGIILLSTSIGNYVGGKIADKDNRERNLKILLLLVAFFILLIAFIQEYVVSGIASGIADSKLGAIITTIILFCIPSMLIGFVAPIVLKLKLKALDDAGKTHGRLTATATIGGIVGTFLGGFILIPSIGSEYILYILAIIIVCLVPLVDLKIKAITNLMVIAILVLSIVFMCVIFDKQKRNEQLVLSGDVNCKIMCDTEYSRVIIYNKEDEDYKIRYLISNGTTQSATYIAPQKVNDLVFVYTTFYKLMFNANINIKNTLLIGGGGYSVPKYYISNYPDKYMDVVEIDKEITRLAKKYFFLDKLIQDYDIVHNKRLKLFNEDGRVFLNKNTKKYDAILNDSFTGNVPPATLTTLEAVTIIKNSLSENGVYLTNIISACEGFNSKFLKAEVKTLKQVFKNVYVIPCTVPSALRVVQNNMVIATDDDLAFEQVVCEINLDDAMLLTDKNCPIETLIPKVF